MDASRKTHRAQMEKQISRWGARLGVLRARFESSGRAEMRRQVDDLHALQESAKQHLEQLVSASAQRWKEGRVSFEDTWRRLSLAVETTWKPR